MSNFMKIATLNIDWAKIYNSPNHFLKIEKFLNQQDFDFLILTEALALNLKNYNFCYFSEQIPQNVDYENLNYSQYLNGEKAFRTIIYSKFPSRKKYQVSDNKTSLALEFETEFGDIVIYATIIGTWFNKLPFAKKELENCVTDCENIYKTNQNLLIVGDLNTSFLENEMQYCINKETTKTIKNLIDKLSLYNTTKNLKKNIDHIIIPQNLTSKILESNVFVEAGILSDHQGIYICLDSV